MKTVAAVNNKGGNRLDGLHEKGRIVMGFIGFIIGAGASFWLSSLFIFPPDALSLKFADMTIDFVLRILGGLFAVCCGAIIGGGIGEAIGSSIGASIDEGMRAKNDNVTASTEKKEWERLARTWGIGDKNEKRKE